MNNFGYPITEMRTLREEFEKSTHARGMDLTMRKDAPYYDNCETLIAYFVFEEEYNASHRMISIGFWLLKRSTIRRKLPRCTPMILSVI